MSQSWQLKSPIRIESNKTVQRLQTKSVIHEWSSQNAGSQIFYKHRYTVDAAALSRTRIYARTDCEIMKTKEKWWKKRFEPNRQILFRCSYLWLRAKRFDIATQNNLSFHCLKKSCYGLSVTRRVAFCSHQDALNCILFTK